MYISVQLTESNYSEVCGGCGIFINSRNMDWNLANGGME